MILIALDIPTLDGIVGARRGQDTPVWSEGYRANPFGVALQGGALYALIFRNGSTIEIVAVMHIRRKPGYWKNRN